jgi:hypothetical protein
MRSDEFMAIMVVLLFALPLAIFVIVTYNDLNRRWQLLLSLAANVRTTRQQRQGVGRDLGRHVGHLQRHEQHVARHGSRRGRGSGKLISDTSNGWPSVQSVGITAHAMTANTESRSAEQAARIRLHAEAQAYNERIRRWPERVVAEWFRFRPWRYSQQKRGHRHPRYW